MATMPSDPRPVGGRIDSAGRLVSADPELEQLQRDAGSSVGKMLALPQLVAIAELARKLGIPVSRPAVVASSEEDIDLWVRATPEGQDILLSLENWTSRPAAAARLTSLLGGATDAEAAAERKEWSADEELRLIAMSNDLAEYLAVDLGEAAGQALTRFVRLEEDEAGEMPLVLALASRRSFTGQVARSRADGSRKLVLSGEVVTSADGAFAGFRGTAETDDQPAPAPAPERNAAFDHAIDEALRSPLDRIIESAERIVERADGPLRNNYATYGGDIAAAARHLLSVVESMSEDPAHGNTTVDLTAVAAETVVMLESTAEERRIHIGLEPAGALPAKGEERAVIQILVNLIGNALRHSPEGGSVQLRFSRTAGTASVTVSDEGPGIDAADQQRIFERFERAGQKAGGTGLGLAISRRLARSMGGDVTLESAPGQGARFTLTLPTA
jgi:signal transduction histidine kinase